MSKRTFSQIYKDINQIKKFKEDKFENMTTNILKIFINKLNNYEPGLVSIIKYFTKTYTFKQKC